MLQQPWWPCSLVPSQEQSQGPGLPLPRMGADGMLWVGIISVQYTKKEDTAIRGRLFQAKLFQF